MAVMAKSLQPRLQCQRLLVCLAAGILLASLPTGFAQYSCDEAIQLHSYALQGLRNCSNAATRDTPLCALIGQYEGNSSKAQGASDDSAVLTDVLQLITNPPASKVDSWQDFLVQAVMTQVADLGEVAYVLNIINSTYSNFTAEITNEEYFEAWQEPWYNQADLSRELAQESASDPLSVAYLYFKATNYYFGGVWPNPFSQEALVRAEDSVDAFVAGLDAHPKWTYYNFTVPFNNGSATAQLPCYLITTNTSQKLPLYFITSGTDWPKEVIFLALGPPALDRGYAVLVFDGPGQGQVIRNPPYMPFFPQWNQVFTAVLDYVAINLSDYVDLANVVHSGDSLGGYLTGQACSLTSDRVKACIVNSAVVSIAPFYQKFAVTIAEAVYGGFAYVASRAPSLMPAGYAQSFQNGTGIMNTLLLVCNASSGAPALVGDAFALDPGPVDPELIYISGGYGGTVSGDKAVLLGGLWQGFRNSQTFGPYQISNISVPVIAAKGTQDTLLGGQEDMFFSQLNAQMKSKSVLFTFDAESGSALHGQNGSPFLQSARFYGALRSIINSTSAF